MKADKLLQELTTLGKTLGYTIRRETGTFRGGGCVVHDERLIIVNKSMPLEAACVIVARALCNLTGADDTFLKPAVRNILQRERDYAAAHPDVDIVVHATSEASGT